MSKKKLEQKRRKLKRLLKPKNYEIYVSNTDSSMVFYADGNHLEMIETMVRSYIKHYSDWDNLSLELAVPEESADVPIPKNELDLIYPVMQDYIGHLFVSIFKELQLIS